MVFLRQKFQVARLIGYNVVADRENNYAAKHSLALIKAKRSDGKYDYFIDGATYNRVDFRSLNEKAKKFKGFKGDGSSSLELDFDFWQVVAPDEFKVTKLEKGAYNYAKSGMISELDEILKSKYEHC